MPETMPVAVPFDSWPHPFSAIEFSAVSQESAEQGSRARADVRAQTRCYDVADTARYAALRKSTRLHPSEPVLLPTLHSRNRLVDRLSRGWKRALRLCRYSAATSRC